MHMDQLKYLIEISNSPSINAASEKLHISYQALSHSVRALEKELGLSLLTRSNKGSVLTEDGEKIVTLSKQFIKGITALQTAHLCDAEQICGTVTFLTMDVCLEGFLYDLIDYLRKAYPGITCKYQIIYSTNQLYEILRKDPTSFAITFHGLELYEDITAEDMRVYNLIKSDLRILCSPSHELAQASSVSLKDLESHQFLLRSYNASEGFSDMWAAQSHVQFEANPLLFEREILYGNCITFAFQIPCAPYWIPDIHNTIRIPLRAKKPVHLALVCHDSFQINPQTQIFFNALFNKLSIKRTL